MRPPLARTNAEAHLYLERSPCESCSATGFTAQSSVVSLDGELCSRYAGPCHGCRNIRVFTFRIPSRVRLPGAEGPVFGGSEPSELLDPGQWLRIADLAAAEHDSEPGSDFGLAAAAVDEVLKFVPEGADRVPPEAMRTQDSREDYEREPGRFHRVRLEAVAEAYRSQLSIVE